MSELIHEVANAEKRSVPELLDDLTYDPTWGTVGEGSWQKEIKS